MSCHITPGVTVVEWHRVRKHFMECLECYDIVKQHCIAEDIKNRTQTCKGCGDLISFNKRADARFCCEPCKANFHHRRLRTKRGLNVEVVDDN